MIDQSQAQVVSSKVGSSLPATSLVVFGATGNLAQKKLIPALYNLFSASQLPNDFKIVFVVRNDISLNELISKAELSLTEMGVKTEAEIIGKLKQASTVLKINSTQPDDYPKLKILLESLETETNSRHNWLYYLAIPPDIFRTVISCLSSAGLSSASNRDTRVLVEKPFGTDLSSAKDLVSFMSEHFDEHQIFRIDHYLAKETAQNMLVFRTNNPLVEDIWGRQYIDHIQITAAEMIGIETRSNFYEQMGALRDIVQSHLLQLMSLVMMEIPEQLNSKSIHEEKLELLNCVAVEKEQHVDELAVRGQYQGYQDDAGNLASKIETFAAIKLEVKNSRWGGVPVLLRTGKQMATKVTEINIIFKDRSRRKVPPNLLTIRIQPNEGISLKLTAKKPGFDDQLQDVQMDFCYQTAFDTAHPDAYERVLVDAIAGDQTLFTSSEEVIRCWEIVEPILKNWQQSQEQPSVYSQGSWGPEASDALAAEFGTQWYSGNLHVCAVHPPQN